MTTKEHNEQLREKFDKWQGDFCYDHEHLPLNSDIVKFFLSHTIPVESVKEVIGKIKEKTKECKPYCNGDSEESCGCYYYNEAIDDVLSLLSTLVDTK